MIKDKILVVDDDRTITELAKKILTQEGYETFVAANGSDALSILRKLQFDVVVSDLNMPVMSGEDLLTVIKHDYPSTEVIIITTYPTVDSALLTLKLGAYDYVTKPMNFDLLLKILKRLSEKKKLLLDVRNERELREKLFNLFEDLQDLFISTVKSLAEAIEAKDAYTFGHCERIREYSLKTGRKLGLSSDESRDLEYASLLHDVGKIAVPENILNKPDKLTDEEFKVIKTHPAKGAQMLGNIRQLKGAILGIKYHHERIDGKGYPEGLKGDEIPLIARIISVSDSYDAMTSDRPYRKGMPIKTATQILVNEKEKQFDGDIVDKFLEDFEK